MADCPDGRMNRPKMKEMFAAIMPKVGSWLIYRGIYVGWDKQKHNLNKSRAKLAIGYIQVVKMKFTNNNIYDMVFFFFLKF